MVPLSSKQAHGPPCLSFLLWHQEEMLPMFISPTRTEQPLGIS